MSWRREIAERHDLSPVEEQGLRGRTFEEMNEQAAGLAHGHALMGLLKDPQPSAALHALVGATGPTE